MHQCNDRPRYDDPSRPGVFDLLVRSDSPPPNMAPAPNWWRDGRELTKRIADARTTIPTIDDLATRLAALEKNLSRIVDVLASQDGDA